MRKKMFRFAGISLILSVFCGCANVDLNPKFFYAALIKRASMEQKYPNGFFQFGLMMEEKDKALLTADNFKGKIKSMEVINPQGKIYSISPDEPLKLKEGNWEGYSILGLKEQQLSWVYADITYNTQTLPPQGTYYAKITTRSNSISSYRFDFQVNPENTLEGFPDQLKYDPATRILTWNAVKGKNVRYRVYAFQGTKQDDLEDWSQMIYASTPTSVPENHHEIPATVKFEKGKPYYLMVEAWAIPFFHIQDKKDQVASFIAQ